ncbi:hypothetical protein F4805DRAFT_464040 [Annulohypoxylon moriforme]|nr:hypothetical protein F4805DRAFT_464040 [Annulohypoxylon moriforme]
MADQSEIIKNNPIGSGLDTFLVSFNSVCSSKDTYSEEALDHLSVEDIQGLISMLVRTLQDLPIARLLPSRTRGPLRSDLLRLEASLDSGDFDFGRAKPLLRAVIAEEPDEEIWIQVYHAVTEPTPPPRPIASHLKQTPSSRNLGSLVNSSERRADTDPVLKEELEQMYVDIPGFHDAFFGKIPDLESASKATFEKCCKGPNPWFRGGWTGWPSAANQDAVLSWLGKIVHQFLLWSPDNRSTPTRGLLTEPNKPLKGSTAVRKLDVGIVSRPEALAHWSQVLIPGELKSNPKEDRHTGAWLDIAKYVREVFATQDTRRFVLAFTLCGSLMRVWEFDRLGGIGSTQFDINKDGLRFVSTILGFLWMDDKGLGFDPTIITANNQKYIDIVRNGIPERIVIDKFLGQLPCIVGRATACWKAYSEGDPSTMLVIKDSWQFPERDVEGELLREATEKGVCNVARYYYHETIRVDDSVDDIQHGIRKGLDITKASNSKAQGLNTPRTSQLSQGSKRSSSQTGAPLPSSKRPRSESPVKRDPVHPSSPQNRIHRRVIVRDYGRNIYEASSCVALLAALESCIQGHKSLLETGILHRDISINNLMINEDGSNPSPLGFLIDLDLAIKVQREGASGAKGKTGTRAFMAIGALLGEQHTFMHDLESFFWVLFWICIHYDEPGKDKVVKRFESWNYINMEDLALQKSGLATMEPHLLGLLGRNCSQYYEPLIPWVNRLRRVVFGNGGQGTADLTLYSRMQEVLRDAQKDDKVLQRVASS